MTEKSYITEEARSYIGKVVSQCTGTVTLSQIKKYAQATMDRNPLYFNEEYAKKTTHGGIVAPLLFGEYDLDRNGAEAEIEILPSGSRADQRGQDVPLAAELDETVAPYFEWKFYHRMRPGDVITATTKITDLIEKVGRRAGRMVFIVYENTLTNQRGEIATTSSFSTIRRKRAELEASPVPEGQKPPSFPTPKKAGGQLFWEDVEVGTEIPVLSRKPTTAHQAMLEGVHWAMHRIHYDPDYARSVGLPDAVVTLDMEANFMAQLLTEWAGELGILRKLGCRAMELCIFKYADLSIGGKVTKKYIENGNCIDCELWVTDAVGQTTAIGYATVNLPKKAAK